MLPALFLGAGIMLSGCGGSGSSSSTTGPGATPVGPVAPVSAARGTLIQPPTLTLSLDAAGVASQVRNISTPVAVIAGTPTCGVDIYHFEYGTVGAAGESTTASGALFVPTGSAPQCGGKQPLVLYGHGSTLQQRFNAANFTDLTSDAPGSVVEPVALFAAQGYIVVVPNYAGYDTSSLNYHPEHIADQNGKDMIDGLTAVRTAFPTLPVPLTENGKLFLAGYSEGGYVTMATHRAMQAAGIAVTASVPQSGDYTSIGYESLGAPDAIIGLASYSEDDAVRLVMQITAWQKASGNVYTNPSDLYSAAYSSKMETLVPTNLDTSTFVSSGLFPAYMVGNDIPGFSSFTPAQQALFGPPAQSLMKTSYLAPLLADFTANPCPITSSTAPLNCSPASTMRKAWLNNDLRTWTPTAPMLICGGHADPEVPFFNAQMIQAYFQAHGITVPVLDVDSPITANDPYAQAKQAFITVRQSVINSGGDPDSQDNYHGLEVSAACTVAASGYFGTF